MTTTSTATMSPMMKLVVAKIALVLLLLSLSSGVCATTNSEIDDKGVQRLVVEAGDDVEADFQKDKKTPNPSPRPTVLPTTRPTVRPTLPPTSNPSPSPTARPTLLPSTSSPTDSFCVGGQEFSTTFAANGTCAGRLNRNGIISTCAAAPKSNPGAFDMSPRLFFQLGPFNVGGPVGQVKCVTVTRDSGCTPGVFPVTYSPNFDPSTITTNYLADPGQGNTASVWSFNLPGGADFVLIFQQVTIGSAVVGCPLRVCVDIP
jgi:hypothetical protein